jgi:predicted aspartyl protease
MPTPTGYFDSSGSPKLRIRIGGVVTGTERIFDAIIDTGFTGFVSMPLVDAFPLGLILMGTTNIVLADHTTQTRLTAWGTAALESGESAVGVVILEWQQGDVLLGMEFLRTLDKGLLLAPHTNLVELINDPPLESLIEDSAPKPATVDQPLPKPPLKPGADDEGTAQNAAI